MIIAEPAGEADGGGIFRGESVLYPSDGAGRADTEEPRRPERGEYGRRGQRPCQEYGR